MGLIAYLNTVLDDALLVGLSRRKIHLFEIDFIEKSSARLKKASPLSSIPSDKKHAILFLRVAYTHLLLYYSELRIGRYSFRIKAAIPYMCIHILPNLQLDYDRFLASIPFRRIELASEYVDRHLALGFVTHRIASSQRSFVIVVVQLREVSRIVQAGIVYSCG